MGKRATFTQAELTRAIRGAMAAGLPLARCTIEPDGSIVLWAGSAAEAANDTGYDAWKASQK